MNEKLQKNITMKKFKLGEIVNIRDQQMEVIINDFNQKFVLDNDYEQIDCDQIEERICCVCGNKYLYPKNDGSDLGCCCNECEYEITKEDIKKYCGIYKHPNKGPTYRILPEHLSPRLIDELKTNDVYKKEKIEDMPEQLMPEYKIPKRETPEWMRKAVEKYPHQTEWD
jgi:hypothetical protein